MRPLPDLPSRRATRSHVALACRTEDKLRKYVPGLRPIHYLQLETAIAKHTRSTAGGSATETQASQKPMEQPLTNVHVLDPKDQEIDQEIDLKKALGFAAPEQVDLEQVTALGKNHADPVRERSGFLLSSHD